MINNHKDMARQIEKLAESLEKLKELQEKDYFGIKSGDLSRVHRERLIKNGFLREVLKGWYVPISPFEQQGDSTSWHLSYWRFCARYLRDRYAEDYCLSPEQSLLLHIGNQTVPSQLMVRSTKGNNLPTPLLFGTSLFVLRSPLDKKVVIKEWNGLRLVSLPFALVHSSPSLFTEQPTDARSALLMISDASDLLHVLLEGGNSVIAGKLAGAYRNMGNNSMAEAIMKTMKSAGYDVREHDPFGEVTGLIFNFREPSPYVNRIRLMWHSMRLDVINEFPASPGIPIHPGEYIEQIERLYTTDAYHSLSIERYSVTPELIERVRTGEWDVLGNEADKKHRDALAARGYWQSFNAVKGSIRKVLAGENPGRVAETDHGSWYTELFAPSVAAGLLKATDLAGYRNHQVYISQSRHTPLGVIGVRDTMPLLFDLLKEEQNASVRAVLGHFFFVYIHPYMDGNGRLGGFLMNVMLSSGGYPWTVIPVQERNIYMDSLEQASTNHNIKPFARFLAKLTGSSLKGLPAAGIEFNN